MNSSVFLVWPTVWADLGGCNHGYQLWMAQDDDEPRPQKGPRKASNWWGLIWLQEPNSWPRTGELGVVMKTPVFGLSAVWTTVCSCWFSPLLCDAFHRFLVAGSCTVHMTALGDDDCQFTHHKRSYQFRYYVVHIILIQPCLFIMLTIRGKLTWKFNITSFNK